MTLEELADELFLSVNYLQKRWGYIVRSRARMGIVLVKLGRGKMAHYGIQELGDTKIRFVHKISNQ